MTLRTAQTLLVLVFLALVTFAFSVVFTIAALAGLTIPSAFDAGCAAFLAVYVAAIVTILMPTTIVQEERLTIRAPREAVYAAMADPRPAPRRNPEVVAVDDLVGEPGVVGTRWRTRYASGVVFTSEVVAAEPPARLVIRSRQQLRGWRRRTIGETERTLVATPAGTELTIRGAVHTTLLGRLVERLQRSQAARRSRWSNERIRDELETDAANHKVALPS